MHAFNASTWEAEVGGILISRPASSTEWIPGQPGLHRETLSGKSQKKKKTFKYSESTSMCWSISEDIFVMFSILPLSFDNTFFFFNTFFSIFVQYF